MKRNVIKAMCLAAVAALSTTAAHAAWYDELSPYDHNAPLGWATVGGTVTGGEGGTVVTVKTKSDLLSALSGKEAKIIYVDGEIEFSGLSTVKSAQNKTLIGLKGSALVNPTHSSSSSKTGVLQFSSCKNIILRNLTFKSAGAYDIDGNDNLTIQGSSYMWIDHCDFQDGVDGNFDCTNGSDNICVTWCRFRYFIEPWAGGSGGSDDHRNCDLWGSSDSKASTDGGKLRTTFANCWWDDGCSERMPRVRFGKVHVINCLYSSSNAAYCVGYGYKSNLYVESCAFTSAAAKKTPWKNYATKSKYTDYNITTKNNLNASDFQSKSGSGEYFIPSDYYTLTAYESSLVEQVVSNEENGAGATLNITSSDGSTGITGIAVDRATVSRMEYFSLAGERLLKPQTGVNIIRTVYTDGTAQTRKIVVR